MMNLTMEKLKESRVTEGACTKILLNIKRLKERSATLKQYLIDYTNGQIDLPTLIQQLSDLMITPIRSKQLAKENQSDEDIPKLFIDVLEKSTLSNIYFLSNHSSLFQFFNNYHPMQQEMFIIVYFYWLIVVTNMKLLMNMRICSYNGVVVCRILFNRLVDWISDRI